MAWIRCCGGTSKKKKYLYAEGVFGFTYENPGSYRWYGQTPNPTVLTGNKISFTGTLQMLGSTAKLDLTDYSTLHIKAKVTSGHLQCSLSTSSKSEVGNVANLNMGNIGVTDEYVLNVAPLTEIYLMLLSNGSNTGEIYEIWLE